MALARSQRTRAEPDRPGIYFDRSLPPPAQLPPALPRTTREPSLAARRFLFRSSRDAPRHRQASPIMPYCQMRANKSSPPSYAGRCSYRTAMIGAKLTWASRADPMSTHLNLQPPVAAGRAAALELEYITRLRSPDHPDRSGHPQVPQIAAHFRSERQKNGIDFWHNVYQYFSTGRTTAARGRLPCKSETSCARRVPVLLQSG